MSCPHFFHSMSIVSRNTIISDSFKKNFKNIKEIKIPFWQFEGRARKGRKVKPNFLFYYAWILIFLKTKKWPSRMWKMLSEQARLVGRSDCVYIFNNCPSPFLSHWELAESVFCSEELSCLSYKNQNLTLSSLAEKFKFVNLYTRVSSSDFSNIFSFFQKISIFQFRRELFSNGYFHPCFNTYAVQNS